jgi:hypothetical protein
MTAGPVGPVAASGMRLPTMIACVAADAGAANDTAALASNRQRNIKTSPLFMDESLVSLRQGYKQKNINNNSNDNSNNNKNNSM